LNVPSRAIDITSGRPSQPSIEGGPVKEKEGDEKKTIPEEGKSLKKKGDRRQKLCPPQPVNHEEEEGAGLNQSGPTIA
jgi:hypothetical protein